MLKNKKNDILLIIALVLIQYSALQSAFKGDIIGKIVASVIFATLIIGILFLNKIAEKCYTSITMIVEEENYIKDKQEIIGCLKLMFLFIYFLIFVELSPLIFLNGYKSDSETFLGAVLSITLIFSCIKEVLFYITEEDIKLKPYITVVVCIWAGYQRLTVVVYGSESNFQLYYILAIVVALIEIFVRLYIMLNTNMLYYSKQEE